MSFALKLTRNLKASKSTLLRLAIAGSLMLVLGACSSQAAREAEVAVMEAERVAEEQQAAEVAQAQAQQRAAEQLRQREAQAAEQARRGVERERQAQEARARATAERERLEAEEQRERERLAAIAAVEAERQSKLNRVAELEQQLAAFSTDTSADDAANDAAREAILVSEELLDVLAVEQSKYENTDADGNTVDPLAKDLIGELESRRQELLRQAN